MSDRYDSLQPPSLIASIASMPRRWKDALHVPAPKNIEDSYLTPGGDGLSVAEHLGATIVMIQILQDAIRTTSYNIPEPLRLEVATAVRNNGSGPWPETAEAGLNTLSTAMEELLDQLKGLSPHDWNKSADAGRETLSILKLAQGASRVAADRLMAVDSLVETLAG
jgi:hypothetical protein